MAGAENQRVKLTKTLLKNSLIELMHSKPVNKITIKELCQNAEINRSTFYLYYTDQYALLNAIEEELVLNIQEHLGKIDSNTHSIQYLESLLSYIEKNADIFETLLCRQENLAFQAQFIEKSLGNLQIKLSPACSEPVLGYVYDYLIMGCLSMIKRWIESDFNMSSFELADLIFRMSDKAVSVFN